MHPAVFAISLLATSFAVLVFFLKRARYRRWNRASGVVVDFVRRDISNDPRHTNFEYFPRVSFRTASGQTAEFVSSVVSRQPLGVGDAVAMLYDPSDPSKATIDRLMFKHLPELVVFCLGLIGVLIYVLKRFAA